ncbi:hypothetical protein ACEL77_003350 [Salmonella enterica subsp. enterica serovar Saintpaul]|nr:hypothetical protein [Salmonella enterica]EHJ6659812.1 hypothetical protein [Salmonella enterica subsp. enterica serovar Saintpaul]EBB3984449.1 hypothetical protein [Salmonella enterica]EBO6747527.1 hypothetical protein [Salmonella enterica]EDS3411918.1 hypothetical protein [Salmonella enterica]
MFIKNKICAALLLVATVSMGANAITKNQSISLEAQIDDPNSAFQVNATAGAWPSTPLNVLWNHKNNSFSNPKPIGFQVTSTEEVTIALSSTAQLNNGKAVIPLNVSVKAGDSSGTSVNNVGLAAQTIMSKQTNSKAVAYELVIEATTTGMKDGDGNAITDSHPTPGSYSGSVDLVFESLI